MSGDAYQPKTALRTTTANKVESYVWAWNRWLLSGELNLLVGAPATGKSALMTYTMAAALGYQDWPDGTRAKRGGYGVFVTTEEDLNKSLLPQMLGYDVPADKWGLFDGSHPNLHLDVLHTKYPEPPRLICVDPIIVGRSGNTNDATAARRIADDWQRVARELRCPVLASIHTVKAVRKHLEQGSRLEDLAAGSGQFVAVSRMAWLYTRPERKLSDRILLRAKCSPHIDHLGEGFRVSSQQGERYGMWQVAEFEELPDAIAEARRMAGDTGGEYQPKGGTAGDAILAHLEGCDGAANAAECKRAVSEALGVTLDGVEAAARLLIKHDKLLQDGGGHGAHRTWSLPAVDDFPDDGDGSLPF